MDILVKVSGVFNLTDARFFAASGVDFIGFCIDEQHPNFCELHRMKEIVSWLEGPVYVLETYESVSPEKIDFFIQETGIHHIHSGAAFSPATLHNPGTFFKEIPLAEWNETEFSEKDYVILTSPKTIDEILRDDIDLLTRLCRSYACFFDFFWQNSDEVMKTIQAVSPKGIVLHGSKEVKTGLKDFDWMEEVFEKLEKI